MTFYSSTKKKKQNGAALLVFMLILIMASSYSLVTKLNANTAEHLRQSSSLGALNEAKAALIGYAVNYPLDHAGEGPGYLACPDINDNGSAGGSCSLGGGTTIGRIPWKTLELSELRDASGERLWYAVSDNFKNNPKVLAKLNSDSPGNFSVDGSNDIVAVIFSPGVPVGTQDRSADPLDVSNYLEDDNADGDVNFVTRSANDFNDTLVTITRQELMVAVEKRVLGDVDEALNNYQTANSAYPWLMPFSDPSTSTFRGALNTVQGHLPFHWSNDPDSVTVGTGSNIAGRNPFTTAISLSWAITSASTTDPGTTTYYQYSGYHLYDGNKSTPGLTCTESSTCVDDNYPGNGPNGLDIIGPIEFTGATCTWSNKETFQCTGSYVNTIINSYPQQLITENSFAFSAGTNQYVFIRNGTDIVVGTGGLFCNCWQVNVHTQYAYTETITRTYTVDITFTDSSGDGADIQYPSSTATRTRDLTVNSADDANALNSGNSSISLTIKDDRQVVATLDGGGTYTRSVNSTRVLTNDLHTTGSITANGILYDIDIDGYDGNSDEDYDDTNEIEPELPSWFVENGWQDLIYVAYASGEPLPGNTTAGQDCVTLGTNCIIATINGTANNDVRAAVFSSGVDLNVARPSGNITDYYEGENSSPIDDIFIKDKITTTYNDQTRIISTAP
jgi:hypothetical protein